MVVGWDDKPGRRGPVEYYCSAIPDSPLADIVSASLVACYSVKRCVFSVTDIALEYHISKRAARRRIHHLESMGSLRCWTSVEDFDLYWAGREKRFLE